MQRSRSGSDLQTANGTSPETRAPEQTAAEPFMKLVIYFVSLLTVDGIAIDDVAFVVLLGESTLIRY